MKRLSGSGGFTIAELSVVLVIAVLLVGMLYPLILHTGRRADAAECRTNLRKIAVAMYIYASEHDGKFPGSLEELYHKNYLGEKDIMDCPASRRTGTPQDPDYVYNEGLSVRSDSAEVLLADGHGNHASFRNALLVNGRVIRMDVRPRPVDEIDNR